MKTVKLAEIRNNLSRYLRLVRQGGRVRILDRDTPIADLVPVQSENQSPERQQAEDRDLLADMMRRGVVRPPLVAGGIPPEILQPGPPDPEGLALHALLEERQSGR